MRRLLSALLLTASVAGGQATPRVPLTDPVYRTIDALGGAGLLDSLIVASRPYSRREVVRLLREARRNLGRLGGRDAWATWAIDVGLRRHADPARALESALLEVSYLDSPDRLIPADSNGKIDARINPLVDYRDGRRYYDGTNAAVETRHTALLGRHVALTAEPRLSVASEGATILSLHAADASLLFGNLSVSVGRESVVWGQVPTGGTVLSRNGPPLDVVRLSTDRPARAPWIFGLLGPLRGDAFIADLGPHQNFPHAKLIGYRLSGAIHPQFELGAQVIDEMGGRGGPPALFRDRLYDLFPLIDIFRSSDYLFSNKLAGIDFRWRMPRWSGFELFFDGTVDDLDARRWKSTFLEDAGYISGFSFSCLVECGTFGVRAEYHQTGIRYYTHGQFTTGIAQNGFVLGDQLGPRGLGSYVTLDWSGRRMGRLSATGAFEVRSGNRYGSATTGLNERGFHFVLIERHPGEKRGRLVAAWEWDRDDGRLTVQSAVGLERVNNFAFVSGQNRTNGLVQVGLEVRP